jgi:hypothetical protein
MAITSLHEHAPVEEVGAGGRIYVVDGMRAHPIVAPSVDSIRPGWQAPPRRL